MPQSDSTPLPSTSTVEPVIDPAIEALINRLVASRLEDAERQFVVQTEAWVRQEEEMRKNETSMRKVIDTLNSQLATAQSQIQVQEPLNSLNPLASISPGTVLIGDNNGDLTANPRKRRRKSMAPVADTAPARNTRSHTLDALPSIPNLSPSVLPTFTTTSPQPAIPVQSPPAPLRPLRKAGKKAVIKPVAQIYRFLPQDMPPDVGGLQKSMALHLRILWALLDAKDVPKDPPSELLNAFAIRFSTEAQLYTCQASGPELIPLHLVRVGTAMSAIRGRLAEQARFVEEHILGYTQACLSRFGLDRWCPDVRQSAYSLYNAACRIVALDTFKQALVSHAYLHLNPNTAYAGNMNLLIRMYDHFVFHYMLLRYRKNDRQPGSVLQQLQASPQYQGRIRLAAARLQFLEENNYPQRYRDLIDSKATSDDECDPITQVFNIKRRPERSAGVQQFFRILDKKREQSVRQDRSRRWRERVRVVPTDQQDSMFSVLPDGMPLDYFDPTFFNALQPRTRNRIAVKKLALLPTITDSLTWCADERLNSQKFTEKFKAVFDQYQIVTDDDIADNGGDDEEWVDNDEAGEGVIAAVKPDDDDFDIASSRGSLSAHLSGSGSMASVR